MFYVLCCYIFCSHGPLQVVVLRSVQYRERVIVVGGLARYRPVGIEIRESENAALVTVLTVQNV